MKFKHREYDLQDIFLAMIPIESKGNLCGNNDCENISIHPGEKMYPVVVKRGNLYSGFIYVEYKLCQDCAQKLIKLTQVEEALNGIPDNQS